jgi:3',5'-cyclic AMP phosphodiesterase CpdA
MKHLIIGDLHGKDRWKDIQINHYDKIIFLGDYVDHWTLPDRFIYQNLQDIIALKKQNPEQIELLLGNHDVQYLHYPHYLCSGFRPTMQRSLTALFNENRDLFKVAYQQQNYLISHAGVTNRWHKDFLELRLIQQIKDEQDTVADLLNKAEQTAQRWILHQAGSSRGGEGPGGITWADRKDLIADMLDGYHQIVGHTVISKVEVVNQENKSATFIDVLDTFTYFHELDLKNDQ